MIKFWVNFILITGYAIPIIAAALAILVCAVCSGVSALNQKRKYRYLETHGYERYLAGVPAFGNSTFYAWRNKQNGKHINELDVKHMSYKSLVRKIEEMRV